MGWQFVQNDDIPLAQCRSQYTLDAELKPLPIHGTIDDARGIDPVVSQASDECLRVPVPGRCMVDQPVTDGCPARCLCHVGLQRGLVNEDKPFEMIAHEGLALPDPDRPVTGQVRLMLLAGAKVFFCVITQAGSAIRPRTNDEP